MLLLMLACDPEEPGQIDYTIDDAYIALVPEGGGLVVCCGPTGTRILPELGDTSATAQGAVDATGILGDVDGDGVEEWLARSVVDGVGTVMVFAGDASGTLEPDTARATLEGETWAYGGTDLDGDAVNDLVAWDLDYVRLYSGVSEGPIDPDAPLATISFPAEDGSWAHGVGDIDGDGVGDLAFGREDHDAIKQHDTFSYLLIGPVVGDVPVDEATELRTADGYSSTVQFAPLPDTDGDGIDDFVAFTTQWSTNAIDVYTGAGVLTATLRLEGGVGIWSGALGDFDDDGRGDVATLALTPDDEDVCDDTHCPGTDEAWLVHGPLVKNGDVAEDGLRLPGESYAVSAGDADRDGIDDLFVEYDGALSIMLGPN